MALQLDDKVELWSVEEVKEWVAENFSEEAAKAFEGSMHINYTTKY